MGCLGLPSVVGVYTGVVTLRHSIPPQIGGLMGAAVGFGVGYTIHKMTFGRWDRACALVEKAKEYKKVSDSEGLPGLTARGMRFDTFLDL